MRENDHLESVRATVQYSAELTQKLNDLYPFAGRGDSQTFRLFQHRAIAYCSFDYTDPADWIDPVIDIALKAAVTDKPKKDLAFSDHGSEHQVFTEVVQSLRQSLAEGTTHLDLQDRVIFVGGESRRVERLLVAAPPYERTIARPAPHQFARELRNSSLGQNEKSIRRALREVVQKYGATFTILACMYLGMDEYRIVELFSDTGFRQAVRQNQPNVRLPHRSNKVEDERMIGKIIRTLSGGGKLDADYVSTSDWYHAALKVMSDEYNFPLDSEARKFVTSVHRVMALGVFKSMVEIAHSLANERFRDPARTVFIDREYARRTSSQLITAYLYIDQTPLSNPVYI